jgi:hypothetical protein
MDEEKVDFKLPLLSSATSYPRWKYDMKIILEVRGVLAVASGEDRKPLRPAPPTNIRVDYSKCKTPEDKQLVKEQAEQEAAERYAAQVENFEKDLAIWKKKDAKAREVIARSLDERHHQMIRSATTALEMGSLFEDMYERKSSQNVFAATQKNTEVKWTDGMSAMAFVAEVKRLAANLTTLGCHVSDESMIAKILNSLPKAYDNMRESWEINMLAGNDLDLNSLIQQLVRHEERLAVSARPLEQTDGCELAAGTGFRMAGKCYNCGLRGHKKEECFAPGGDAFDPNYKKNVREVKRKHKRGL